MKATFALLADYQGENYGRKLMMEANRIAKMGFEMARLPQHISLKQPFQIPSLEAVEAVFDEFVESVHGLCIPLVKLMCYESNVLGYDTIKPGTYFCYKVVELS